MKQLIILTFLLLSFTGFSQTKKTVKSGYITFNSNTMFEFKNMTIENDSVTYYNDVAKNQMGFNIRAVKKIVDNYGDIIYDSAEKSVVKKPDDTNNPVADVPDAKKTEQELLVYKKYSKILLNGKRISNDKVKELLKPNIAIYNKYMKGRTKAITGDILFGAGLGLVVGAGINNITNANKHNGKGSSAPIIIGLVSAAVGIPILISGTRNSRESIQEYNDLPLQKQASLRERSDIKLTLGLNGIGLQVQF